MNAEDILNKHLAELEASDAKKRTAGEGCAVAAGSAVRRPTSKHRDEWVRGYFCAVAMLLKETCAEGAANTEAVSLFKNGGPWHDADAEDIETFQRHGLIPSNSTGQPRAENQ